MPGVGALVKAYSKVIKVNPPPLQSPYRIHCCLEAGSGIQHTCKHLEGVRCLCKTPRVASSFIYRLFHTLVVLLLEPVSQPRT